MMFHKKYELIKQALESSGHKIIIPLPDEFYSKEKDVKLKAMRDFDKNLEQSDAILVANYEKNGIENYIGINSIMEIGMAFNKNKKIFILNNIPDNCKDELEAAQCVVLKGDLKKIQP